MVWALLALLGIPIWFIAIALFLILKGRRGVMSDPAFFRFNEWGGEKWKRSPSFGRWVSDVLVVHSGPALVSIDARQVAGVEVGQEVEPPLPRGLGDRPQWFMLDFTDGHDVKIAVSNESVEQTSGPFV